MGLAESADCRLCGQHPEKADHILRECTALLQHRWDSFGTPQFTPDMDWEVSGLRRFLQDARVSDLETSEDDDRQSLASYVSEDDELR